LGVVPGVKAQNSQLAKSLLQVERARVQGSFENVEKLALERAMVAPRLDAEL
jgi:hypothetical protein